MQTNALNWAQYLQLYQQCHTALTRVTSAAQLSDICRQLSVARLGLTGTAPADLWQHSITLPRAIIQTELLLQLCHAYAWPGSIVKLLLHAGFCSALADASSLCANFTALKPYPALLAAKLLQSNTDQPWLAAVLAGCYPTERNVAPWQQLPLSIVLTQTDYLCHNALATLSLPQRIGQRIVLTKSEYELQLLRRLLSITTAQSHPTAMPDSRLPETSQFQRWLTLDNHQLADQLRQSAELSAAVLTLASTLNRQQQAVTDVRLALNLLGRAQLPFVLAEAELQHSLAQRHHPAQALLQQFSRCLAQALHSLLAPQLLVSQSRALALCLCTPLWLSSSSYASGLLRSSSGRCHSALDVRCYRQPDVAKQVLALVRHYQLAEWQSAVFHWWKPPAAESVADNRLALALQLAWHASLVLVADHQPNELQSLQTLAQQQQLLQGTVNQWLQLLAAQTHCQYPLLLTL